MLNIGVLVSGGGTNLQKLIDAQAAGQIENGRLRVVIASRPDAYALERAKKAGIEAITLRRKDYPDVDTYSQALIDALQERQVDLVVLAGFLTITGDNFVEAFRNRIINVHPALLPAFGGKGYYGLHVHEAVLARGVKVTGATVHFVNEVCDGGPIILQKGRGGEGGRHPRNPPAPGDGGSRVDSAAPGGVPVLPGQAVRGGRRGAHRGIRETSQE